MADGHRNAGRKCLKNLGEPTDSGDYKRMLELTSAHIKNNDPVTNANKNENTQNLALSQLFTEVGDMSGSGLELNNNIENVQHVEYMYWNDRNELVDRLPLLHASMRAGNNFQVNKITAISEKLRGGGGWIHTIMSHAEITRELHKA
ncbi:hypothetical protein PR048_010995 [Dryococelus australis]|uniref:Uncharacterized protein n=1 Tax=Dryococelus australis TaxID=614101 RepID=A0ABQ9HKW1_9NEOP|nr:hypothetical protein PR048_010995 [Dryococelus australis]